MPDPTPVRTDPAEAARQAADALGVAFDDEGPYSREMTASALAALGTCAYYLRVCLGDAHPAAIPAVGDLGAAALSLHAAIAALRTGLRAAGWAIDRRQLPTDYAGFDAVGLAAARAALARAVDALAVAADALAEVHDAAAARPTDTTQTAGGDS